MIKRINKILAHFKVEKLKNDKRIVVFLVCVLIATALWFLNALSKDYTTSIYYPVKYVNAPKNQFLSNEPPSKLELKVDAHGFTLLRHKLSLSFSPIVLNLNNITRNLKSENGVYSVNTNSLSRGISSQVSNEISVSDIRPEIIKIVLDSLKTQDIPVKTDIEVKFKPQFNLKSPVTISPEKVRITGPATIIDTIRFLKTKQKVFDKLDAKTEKTVEVLHPEGTSIIPEKIMLDINVEKFTEKELSIPIVVKNKPENVNIKLFPSELKLSILVGLSEFENITSSDFSAVIDYNSIKPESKNLEVGIESKPDFVQVIRYTPKSVEYLIEIN
ncbi:MAG: CdaR family protein [Bacteroidota bacterium]